MSITIQDYSVNNKNRLDAVSGLKVELMTQGNKEIIDIINRLYRDNIQHIFTDHPGDTIKVSISIAYEGKKAVGIQSSYVNKTKNEGGSVGTDVLDSHRNPKGMGLKESQEPKSIGTKLMNRKLKLLYDDGIYKVTIPCTNEGAEVFMRKYLEKKRIDYSFEGDGIFTYFTFTL